MKTSKETILKEASKLFRKKGYAGTSVQDIAQAVGVKAASLYNHISSKQEILQELCMPISRQFSQGMIDISESTLNPFEKLQAIVSLHIKVTQSFTDSMSLITGDWIHLEGGALKEYKASRKNYEQSFRTILEHCKKENLIDKNINTEVSLFSILSSLHWLYSWRERHQEISSIELEKQLKNCLLNGLK